MKRNNSIVIGICVAIFVCIVMLIGRNRSSISNDEIDVFCIVPVTGPGSAHGENICNAIHLYKKNNPTSKLRFEIQDSQSSPQVALSLYRQRLLSGKPNALISVLSGVTQVLLSETAKEDIPLFAIHTNIQDEFKKYANAQKVTDNFSDVSRPLAKFALRKGLRNVAILFSNEEYGIGCKDVFVSEFSDSSHRIAFSGSYEMKDVVSRDLIYKAVGSNPDAIFVAGYGPNYIFILKTLLANKYKGMILSDINCSNYSVMEALGDLTSISNLYFTGMEINTANPTGTALEFVTQFRTMFNKNPWEGAVYMYDLCSIMEKMHADGKELSRKSFTELHTWNGLSDPIEFPGDGTSSYAFFVIELVNGKPVKVK